MPRLPMLPLLDDAGPMLATARFGRTWQGHAHVSSTNTLAAEWAAAGAPEGSVVLAEYQSAGRGRLGRSWEACSGVNLTFSVVLRPSLAPDRLGLITLAAGVAVAEAVDRYAAPLRAAIKWPNDVLLEGRKCCGMLLEAASGGTVILGIGLNVNQDAFQPALAERATSLLLATGRLVPRAPLLAALLERLEHHYDSLALDEGERVRSRYAARLAGLGRPATLRLTDTGEPVRGRLAGITPTGALLLETDQGTLTFHAGEVTSDR